MGCLDYSEVHKWTENHQLLFRQLLTDFIGKSIFGQSTHHMYHHTVIDLQWNLIAPIDL
jgi:hypothetical protein